MKADNNFRERITEALGRLNDDGLISIAVKDSDGFRTRYIPLPDVSVDGLLDALLYVYDLSYMGDN